MVCLYFPNVRFYVLRALIPAKIFVRLERSRSTPHSPELAAVLRTQHTLAGYWSRTYFQERMDESAAEVKSGT